MTDSPLVAEYIKFTSQLKTDSEILRTIRAINNSKGKIFGLTPEELASIVDFKVPNYLRGTAEHIAKQPLNTTKDMSEKNIPERNMPIPINQQKEKKTNFAQRRAEALANFLKHLIQAKKLEPTQLPFTTKELISVFNKIHPKELHIGNADPRGFIFRSKSTLKKAIGQKYEFSKNGQGDGMNRIKDILTNFPYKL